MKHYASKSEQYRALIDTGIVSEVEIKASLASGKGGQHVNKVSTKAELYWSLKNSKVFDINQKQLIAEKLSTKISKEGVLRITCDTQRTYFENSKEVLARFLNKIALALKKQKTRVETQATRASVLKRLDNKAKVKLIKLNRKKTPID